MNRRKGYRYYELDKSTKLQVLQRDRFCCRVCGDSPVDVHEIVPRSAFGSANKERCFVVKNRVCLCRLHHQEAHNYDKRVAMLEELRSVYNYDYPEEEYRRYLTGEN